METVGVIGCGLMGKGIVKNLLLHNYEVYVNDINETAVNELVAIGAKKSETIEEMVLSIDTLILSLPSPPLIRDLVIEKVLPVMKTGGTILDMSTNDVEMTRDLQKQASSKGIEFFDCPLSGGPAGAEAGTLTVMVGGNEEAFPSILPILEAVGETIEYVGQSGAGQTVKLCHNMVVGGVIGLLSEALLAGEKSGVDKQTMEKIFQKGSAQTKVMDVFGSNIINNQFDDVKFSLSNLTKDMLLYRSLAEGNQTPTLASQSFYQLFQIALNQGKGSADSTAVYELFTEISGKGVGA
ncbi:NAD(P)-dependent oxidoreductase [Ornithinibacillus halophilus]|uniref:3-hydroxyisobutyrate dehydrogenase n=1 Tax=Ornithinibacillus halophilus TaxID=930117 RepID=A0A1M5GSZ9_9BACI|nr:NAD(P)-dependent oxidoreductase [Ornithinibacillus halophilus]SHG06753.1 3-hydroxyisobutyrate dehydrogenase [Ornithinibacillus halophilus]